MDEIIEKCCLKIKWYFIIQSLDKCMILLKYITLLLLLLPSKVGQRKCNYPYPSPPKPNLKPKYAPGYINIILYIATLYYYVYIINIILYKSKVHNDKTTIIIL